MRYFLLTFFVLITFSIFAKKIFTTQTTYHVGLQNVGIGMPPHFINGRLQLGIDAGFTNAIYSKHKKNFGIYTAGVGYFAQQSLQRVAYLKIGLGYHIAVKKKWKITPCISNSFMLVRQTNEEFVYQGNGVYKKVNPYRMQNMPNVGVEINYQLAKSKKLNYQLFTKYEMGLQLPFSNLSSVLPLNQLQLGLAFSFLPKQNIMPNEK